MNEPGFDYPALVQDALRGLVRRVLERVAEEGFPGEHHAFVGFRTQDPGVRIPGFLRDLHPQDLTIVLQHQYWDLVVDEQAFAVTLTFGGSRHRLRVPFAALTGYADPSVGFGLRLERPDEVAPSEEPEAGDGEGADDGEGPSDSPGGQVVSIDRFRKK